MDNFKKNKILRNITIIIAITFLISIISRSLTTTIITGAVLNTMILVYTNCINERLYFEWKHILSIELIFVGVIVTLNGLILCIKAHNAIDINELKSDNIKSGTYVKGNLMHLYTREMNDGTKEVENNGFSGSVFVLISLVRRRDTSPESISDSDGHSLLKVQTVYCLWTVNTGCRQPAQTHPLMRLCRMATVSKYVSN